MSTRGHCHLYVPSVHVRQGAHLESVAPLGFGPCLSLGQIPHGVSNLHNHTGPNRPHSHPKRPKPPVSRSARGKPCYDLRFPQAIGAALTLSRRTHPRSPSNMSAEETHSERPPLLGQRQNWPPDKVHATLRAAGGEKLPTRSPGPGDPPDHSGNSFQRLFLKGKHI